MAESENYHRYAQRPGYEDDDQKQAEGFGNEVSLNRMRGVEDINRPKIPADMTEADENWKTQLRDKNLEIIVVSGDGNCLFRAVAHQVYGDESLHSVIRAKVIEYLAVERNYFFEYVDENYELYLDRMKLDGTWGGNVEIQAMCEIYGRPIEIFAYSATPMRTYTNEIVNLTPKPPIRLSYHTRSHYNSIINPATHCDSINRRQPGDAETEMIEKRIELRAMEDVQKLNATAFQQSIRNSRNQFAETCAESPFDDMDTAIALSLQTEFDKGAEMELQWEDQLVQKAIDASIQSNAMQEMGLPLAVQQLIDMGWDMDKVILMYSKFEGENLPQEQLLQKLEQALFQTLG